MKTDATTAEVLSIRSNESDHLAFAAFARELEDLQERTVITDINKLDVVERPEGTIERYGLVTASGYAYAGNVTLPHNQTSDIAVIGKSAWCTSSQGHNEHTALKFAEDGLVTAHLANEGSYRPDKLPWPKTGMTLADTAAVVLHFARFATDTHSDRLDSSVVTAVGESEGGMEGMGEVALSTHFGFNILMADFTAPCIPQKLQLRDAKKFVEQLIAEPREIARLGGKIALQLALHYPSTLDLHPYAVAHQLAKGAAVFSGDAGKLAKLVPEDARIHISTFHKDSASMPDVWREIFSHHPNVRITPLLGSHLTIADPETLAYIRARQQAARIVYDNHGRNISEITGDEIFDYAHLLVSDYVRPHPRHAINAFVRRAFGSRSILPTEKAA